MAVCNSCGRVFKDSARGRVAHEKQCKRKVKFRFVPPQERPVVATTTGADELLVGHEYDDNPQHPANPSPPQSPSIAQQELELEPVEVEVQRRRRRLPARFIDHVISLAAYRNVSTIQADLHSPSPEQDPSPSPEPIAQPDPIEITRDTPPNTFGVFRRYIGRLWPSRDSDETQAIDFGCDANTFENVQQAEEERQHPENEGGPDVSQTMMKTTHQQQPFFPFNNYSRYSLIHWWYDNPSKSINDFQRLIDNIITDPEFSSEDVVGMDVKQELKLLDNATIPHTSMTTEDSTFSASDGWRTSSVKIKLPPPNRHFKFKREEEAPEVEIGGIQHRSILEGITRIFQRDSFFNLHLKGFQSWWKRSEDTEPERVYSEVYTSEAFLEIEKRIPSLSEEDAKEGVRESVVAPVMLYSDSTHLANFGTASLWPIYMYIGLLSQYIRSKLSASAAFHLAYIVPLPGFIEEKYHEAYGVAPSTEMITHLKRELVQAIWTLLLTPEFIQAYAHGFIVLCADNIRRRIYPRFFVYSCDYPEKVIMACIKYLGACPCVQCYMDMKYVPELGMQNDMRRRRYIRIDTAHIRSMVDRARKLMFEKGYQAHGTIIRRLLGPMSLTPTRNAFSRALHAEDFNYYQMFVIDFLHEVELGVWKALFQHLLRILYTIGDNMVVDLNKRYSKVPSFGRATIRRFSQNVSDLKKPAARDYEDLLLCALPCFEGLIPMPHDKTVMDLLFIMALWHGLAKMRVHTDTTVAILRGVTTELGQLLRSFRGKVCPIFQTEETPEEHVRRLRRTARKARRAPQQMDPVDAVGGRRQRTVKKDFNLSTYKFHALGHYADTIVRFGSTLSYSSQTGESEHRASKQLYPRTNKRGHTKQLATHRARKEKLGDIRERITSMEKGLRNEALPPASPDLRYQMAQGSRNPKVLPVWLPEHEGDPAVKNFIPKLKDHVLRRLFDSNSEEFTDADRNKVQILRDTAYFHQILRINYTTYDMRRDQDIINVRSRSDVMVLSSDGDGEYPFWHCRVIGIIHIYVRLLGSDRNPQRLDTLWVRWYGLDNEYSWGFTAKRLPRIGFGHSDDPDTFGFLDPSDVVRACHLIPVFPLGQTNRYLPPGSVARQPDEGDKDYLRYYVSLFVDRDMLCRYSGIGIGHSSMQLALRTFLESIRSRFMTEKSPDSNMAGHDLEDLTAEGTGPMEGGAMEDEVEENEAADDEVVDDEAVDSDEGIEPDEEDEELNWESEGSVEGEHESYMDGESEDSE